MSEPSFSFTAVIRLLQRELKTKPVWAEGPRKDAKFSLVSFLKSLAVWADLQRATSEWADKRMLAAMREIDVAEEWTPCDTVSGGRPAAFRLGLRLTQCSHSLDLRFRKRE